MFFFYSLVCGDVCGKFNVLYGRVRNVLKKNKDFEVKQEREKKNSCIIILILDSVPLNKYRDVTTCTVQKSYYKKGFLSGFLSKKKKSMWAGTFFFSVSSAFFNHCPSNAFFTN